MIDDDRFWIWWRANHPKDWWKAERNASLDHNTRSLVTELAREAFRAGEIAGSQPQPTPAGARKVSRL